MGSLQASAPVTHMPARPMEKKMVEGRRPQGRVEMGKTTEAAEEKCVWQAGDPPPSPPRSPRWVVVWSPTNGFESPPSRAAERESEEKKRRKETTRKPQRRANGIASGAGEPPPQQQQQKQKQKKPRGTKKSVPWTSCCCSSRTTPAARATGRAQRVGRGEGPWDATRDTP